MDSYQCKTPVAFLIFNRPQQSERVFAQIANVRPRKLLVVADGPREDVPADKIRCEATRQIVRRVNWDCEVLTNFSDSNLGCALRVSSGIDWVFENTEEAIFLEDDCLPHPTFFRFCDETLESYRHDERIMSISGDNFQFGKKRWEYSYYFSRFVHVWGWASWRRAWKHYDLKMSLWPTVRDQRWLEDILGSRREAAYWSDVFEQAYQGETGTWDYQWVFACWIRSGLSILPNMNLISNIGFGGEATHTVSGAKTAEIPLESMAFPLKHPPILVRDAQADERTSKLFFSPSRVYRTKQLAKRNWNKWNLQNDRRQK